MKMKKVFLPIFIFLLAAAGAYCQDAQSITTEIQGVVPRILVLDTDMTDVETVDLVNANSAYLGKISIYTNTASSMVIVISSKNLGVLAGLTAGNTDTYPYLLEFGTVDRINLRADFRMTYSSLVAGSTAEFPVKISYTKLMDLEVPVVADTYSDIVTITVIIS